MMCMSMFLFVSNFHKKLIPLLAMEMMMIVLIFSFFLAMKEYPANTFLVFLIFIIMMVLDSVFGISLLISASRNSTKMAHTFF